MRASGATKLVGVATIVIAALGPVQRAADEQGQRLGSESDGLIELTDEKVLTLVGLRGETILRAGKAGEISFASLKADDRKTELPVDIWLDGTVLTLRAAAGQGTTPRLLDITLPPGLDVKVDTESSTILGSGLDANLTIRGAGVAVDIRGLDGSISIEAKATKLRVESVTGAASIRARDTEITAAGLSGGLSVSALRGTLAVTGARSFNGELDAVSSKIEAIADPVQIRAKSGRLALSGARQGGEITLAGTTLQLERCEGAVTVTSDTAVAFKNCKAALRFDGDGMALTGEQNFGSVEVRTRAAAVGLSGFTGPVRIEGDGLDVKLEKIVGEVTVKASSSEVSVSDVQGLIDIDGDGGGIVLDKVRDAVKIKSRGGDVTVSRASGPVDVDADGSRVEIAWSAMSFQGKCDIKNASGAVVVRLSNQAGTRIEAESKYGVVETRLPKVLVMPDRHSAQGVVGFPGQSVITIVASGDIQLLGGDEVQDAVPEDDD